MSSNCFLVIVLHSVDSILGSVRPPQLAPELLGFLAQYHNASPSHFFFSELDVKGSKEMGARSHKRSRMIVQVALNSQI